MQNGTTSYFGIQEQPFQNFRSTEYSTHAGHGKIQVFTNLGWPPCVRISEMVAFLGTNFMSDIQSWDYTHADNTSVLFLTPPPPTVPNPDQSHPCQECGIHGVRLRTYSFCCIKCRFATRIRPGGEYPFCCMKCRRFSSQKFDHPEDPREPGIPSCRTVIVGNSSILSTLIL
jgi:hypothetical protein